MKRIQHRVDTRLQAPTPQLPRDAWVGETFVEADGTELESVWDGCGPLPGSLAWSERGAAYSPSLSKGDPKSRNSMFRFTG